MSQRARPLHPLALAVVLLVAACSGSGGSEPSGSAAGLPFVEPSTAPATEEPLATENIASEPPVAADLAVKVTKAPGSVRQGGTTSASIKTTKAASCDIDVQYKSGSSNAKGLETKRAGANGAVTWKWEVGQKTTKGKWPVLITCSLGDRSGDAETSITVK